MGRNAADLVGKSISAVRTHTTPGAFFAAVTSIFVILA
jgi:hypothetical protein